MKASTIILAACVLSAGCNGPAKDQRKTEGKPLTAPPDHRIIFQCDGEGASQTSAYGGEGPIEQQTERRTYRLDEEKQTLELWDQATDKWMNLCVSDCSLSSGPQSFRFSSIPKLKSGMDTRVVQSDRIAGTIADKSEKMVVTSKGGIYSVEAFRGTCRKVAKPEKREPKF